jgi:hypothetical protein
VPQSWIYDEIRLCEDEHRGSDLSSSKRLGYPPNFGCQVGPGGHSNRNFQYEILWILNSTLSRFDGQQQY